MSAVIQPPDRPLVFDLRDAVAGDAVTPDDEAHHRACAGWNGRIDRFPGLVEGAERVRAASGGIPERFAGLKAEFGPGNSLNSDPNVGPAR